MNSIDSFRHYAWITSQLIGISPRSFSHSLKGLPAFFKDRRIFLKQYRSVRSDFEWGHSYPCLEDRYLASGAASGHYFHQDLLVAQMIALNTPIKHVDIGSRVDGFVAHVASFREIEVMDIRKQDKQIRNIIFKQADLMDMNFSTLDYCDSVSALHSLEHFGLGRYGDTVNSDGHLVGFNNIFRILKRGGRFYFSVPIGRSRIEFNAHRVFSLQYLLDIINPYYTINSYSYVNDIGELVENSPLTGPAIANNCGCHWGCGIFELIKR